jgi:hypothetical protein
MTDPGVAQRTPEPAPHCPWCNEPVRPEDKTCRACGAAIAQRDDIAGLKIPGLTSVDPALEDYDKRPMHLRGPSASHAVAPALIVAAAGGPIGLVAIGGVAAVAAAEYMGTKHGASSQTALEDIGKPHELLVQALERSKDPTAAGAGAEIPEDATEEQEPDHAEDDGGRSIWRDLPPAAQGDEQGSV